MVLQSPDCTVQKNALRKTANNKTKAIGKTGAKMMAVIVNETKT
jgi:hypothetical protein